MSPSKSKSKSKEASGKSTANPNTGYNPLLGTFQTLEPTPSSAPPILANGRFRNIDDTSEEYDSVSNNGSCSGESEDHKDKNSQNFDSDRREKIRQKNEKKHQRQRERRAQELHEKCCGYLMSRKLEKLSQQLVAMGFSSERATMALILNEGKLEESVNWILEEGEEENLQNHKLKIEIAEELDKLTEMEKKFNCSKQEVERAIIASEGNLDQAAETLRVQKLDPPKPEKTVNPVNPAIAASKMKPLTLTAQSKSTPLVGATAATAAATLIQQKRDDNGKDFNYARTGVTVGPPVMESGSKNMQLLTTMASQSKSKSTPLQASPLTSKTEAQLKNLQVGPVREPVIMMQRPQTRQIPATTSISSGWRSGGGAESATAATTATTARSFTPPSYGGSIRSQFYDPYFQQQHSGGPGGPGGPLGRLRQLAAAPWPIRPAGPNTTTTLVAAASLGLFSGLGSDRTSARGSDPVSDFASIDWSVDPAPSSSSWPNRSWRWRGDRAAQTAMRGAASGGSVAVSGGMHSDVVGVRTGSETSGGGSLEWSSHFEENDILNLPTHFFSSHSL